MYLWRRRPEQRRRSQGHSTPAPGTPQRTPSRALRSSPRALEQESRIAVSSNPRHTRYDRLPSAGITNSPSWPSFTTHQRSDPPVIPARSVNAHVAPQSSAGSMGYRESFSSLAHSTRSTGRTPHTGVQAPPFAPRPEPETWQTGHMQPKPIGSQPPPPRQPEYQHPLHHIDDLSSSFAQHLGMPQTTQSYRNGKSPQYPIRRTIYGQLLPRDRASSEDKTMSSSPPFQPKIAAVLSSPIPFGGPSELRRLNRPVSIFRRRLPGARAGHYPISTQTARRSRPGSQRAVAGITMLTSMLLSRLSTQRSVGATSSSRSMELRIVRRCLQRWNGRDPI
jgi:hypothetical protein